MLKQAAIFILLSLLTSSVIAHCRCQPGESCWPSKKEWGELRKAVGGRLVQPVSPLKACYKNSKSNVCKAALKSVKNPFALQSKPGNS